MEKEKRQSTRMKPGRKKGEQNRESEPCRKAREGRGRLGAEGSTKGGETRGIKKGGFMDREKERGRDEQGRGSTIKASPWTRSALRHRLVFGDSCKLKTRRRKRGGRERHAGMEAAAAAAREGERKGEDLWLPCVPRPASLQLRTDNTAEEDDGE